MKRLVSHQGFTKTPEASEAVRELEAQLMPEGLAPAIVMAFCSPAYDLERLGPALKKAFPCPVLACTTAGQIGRGGFQPEGITAAALASPELEARLYLVAPLGQVSAPAIEVAKQVRRDHEAKMPSLGLVLIDGLSLAEEHLVATLHHALDGMAIVGGSAGDDMAFERTWVYYDGAFHTNAAVLAAFRTTLPFKTFKFQNFVPTSRKLVTTAATPQRRLVHEFNGKPASLEYANALGLKATDLTPEVFSANPLILHLGNEHYVRSVRQAHSDGSLAFFCAVDEAVVFSIGRSTDLLAVENVFDEIRTAIGEPEVIIGCDCILRRLDLEQADLSSKIGALFEKHRVVGFNTYGEQWNGMHVNQTFAGVAWGG